jgi:hypothetical protein
MEDRRKDERFKLRLTAKLEVSSQYGNVVENNIVGLETDNICSGGAYFTTLSPLGEGTPVKVDLLLDFDRLKTPRNMRPLIKVIGNVVRSGRTGMAIRFKRRYQIIPPLNA